MGEAYKGLTIRIGADVSKLQQAMRTTASAISSVQSQLRLLDKTMKLDPTNIIAAAQKMELFRDKAQLTAKQIGLLREEENQLKASEGVAELIAKTENLEAHLASARDKYNSLDETLARMRVQMEAVAKANGIAFKKNHVEQVADEIARVDGNARELVEQYKRLAATWESVENDFSIAKQAAGLKELEVRLNAATVEVRDHARSYAEIATARNLVKGMEQEMATLTERINVSSDALNFLESEARGLKAALEFSPENIDLLTAKTKNAKEQTSILNEQIATLRERVDMLSAGGYRLEESTESIVLRAKESAEAFTDVKASLETSEGKAMALEKMIAECKDQSKSLKTEFEGIASRLSTAEGKVSNFTGKLEEAQKQSAEIKNEMAKYGEELTNANSRIKNLSDYIAANSDRMEELREKAVQFREQLMFGKGDAEEIKEQLQQIRIEMKTFKEANSELRVMEDRVSTLTSKMSDLNARDASLAEDIEKYNVKLDKASEKVRNIYEELGTWDAKSEANKQALEEYRVELEKVLVDVKRLKEAEASAEEAASYDEKAMELRRYENQIIELTAKVERLKMEEEAAAFSGRKVLTGLTSLGTTLSYTLSAAVMMAGMYFVNYANEIDSAYRNMRKTVEGTEEQFVALKDAAIAFSQTHITSADKILEIEAMGGQMGIAVENLESFANVVANLDIATDIDAEGAAEDLGQLSNILKDLNEDTFANFSDSLVRLGNNNAAMESSILSITDRIGAMGSILGMTTPEILAWSTAVAATGQGAEAAGTAVSKTMSDIESAVSANGDKLQAFAKISGMSAEQFAAAWRSSPSAAMQEFVEGLARVKQAGGSVDDTLMQLGIRSVRQKQALQGLVMMTDTLADGEGVLTNALLDSQNAWDGVGREIEGVGDAQLEADKKSQGFSGTLGKMLNSVAALGVQVGEGLIAPMNLATSALGAAEAAMKAMPGPIKTVIATFGLATIAIGPLLRGLGSLVTFMPKLKEQFTLWQTSLKASTEEMKKASIFTSAYVATNMEEVIAKYQEIAATNLSTAAKAKEGVQVTLNTAKYWLLTAAMNAAATASRFLTAAMPILAVIGLVASLGSLAVGMLSNIRLTDELTEKHKQLMEAVSISKAEAEDNAASITGLGAKYAQLSAEMDRGIVNQSELSAVGKQLAGTSDALAGAFDSETGAALISADAISALAASEAERIKQSEYQKQLNELINEEVLLKGKLEKVTKDNVIAYDEYGNAIGAAARSAEDYEEKLKENVAKQKEFTDVMTTTSKKTTVMERAYRQLGGSATATEDQLSALNKELGVTVTSEEYAAFAAQKLAEKQLNVAKSVSKMEESLEELVSTSEPFAQYMAMSGMSVEQLAQKLEAAGVDADGFKKSVEELATSTSDAFNKIEVNTKNTVAAAMENLQANIEATRSWKDNLNYLFNEAGLSFNQSFLDQLRAGGVENYGEFIQELVTATQEGTGIIVNGVEYSAQEIIDKFGEAGAEGAAAAAAEWQAGSDGIVTAVEDSVSEAGDAGVNQAEQSGADIDNSLGAGIENNSDVVVNAAKSVTESVKSVLDDAESSAYTSGQYFAQGFANGIESNSGLSAIAASAMGAKAAARLRESIEEGSPSRLTMRSGKFFGQGFGLGIKSQWKYVEGMAGYMANVSLAALSDVNPKDMAKQASRLAGNLSDSVTDSLQRNVNVNVTAPEQASSGNTYIIQNLDFSGDQDIEAAMLTIFNKMQRIGRM